MPVGTILPFTIYNGSLAAIPEKWAICNGSNGTPDLTGRFLEGVTSSPGSIKSAGLPNIKGSMSNLRVTNNVTSSGVISLDNLHNGVIASGSSGMKIVNFTFDAQRCSDIYRDDITTVQPKSYCVLYIMKIKA